MAKKKKKEEKIFSGPTLIDKLPKDHGEWLELCIKFTLRVVKDPPDRELDRDMLAQADRLKKELEEWRKNERKSQKTTT